MCLASDGKEPEKGFWSPSVCFSDGSVLLRSQSLWCSGETGPRFQLLGGQTGGMCRRLSAHPGKQGVQVGSVSRPPHRLFVSWCDVTWNKLLKLFFFNCIFNCFSALSVCASGRHLKRFWHFSETLGILRLNTSSVPWGSGPKTTESSCPDDLQRQTCAGWTHLCGLFSVTRLSVLVKRWMFWVKVVPIDVYLY